MRMRCKVRLQEITECASGNFKLLYVAVCGDTDASENTKFWKYTPSGKIEFEIVSKETVAQLKVGSEYYVDFAPASIVPAAIPPAPTSSTVTLNVNYPPLQAPPTPSSAPPATIAQVPVTLTSTTDTTEPAPTSTVPADTKA